MGFNLKDVGALEVIEGNDKTYVADEAGDTIATMGQSWPLDAERALAKLFAASPELLAACESMATLLQKLVDMNRLPANVSSLREGRAAISKVGRHSGGGNFVAPGIVTAAGSGTVTADGEFIPDDGQGA